MEEHIRDLAKYRLQCSFDNIVDAQIMYDNGKYKTALNRSYYAIFHAVRAINALNRFDSSKHSGVISYFNQNYVKTGMFPKNVAKLINESRSKREKADYLDFYVASKVDAQEQLENARIFYETVSDFLNDKLLDNDVE